MNKYDLVVDTEIVEEYKKQFLRNLNIFLEKEFSFEIEKESFDKNSFVVSAASHFGLEQWTKGLVNILKDTKLEEHAFHAQEIDSTDILEIEMIKEITKQEKNNLLSKGYIEEVNSEFIKVWEIDNPEVCKMAFITMWGNDEAEMRFWKNMGQKGFITEFENNGIRKGDVLKIKSYYEGYDDRYILY